MTHEELLLVGRRAVDTEAVLGTHARRLRERGVVDGVRTLAYDRDPAELRDDLATLPDGRTYVLPMSLAHSYETTADLPAALSFVPGEVRYCEPVGGSPAVTDVVVDRASTEVEPAESSSILLVGFGNSSQPYHRRTVDAHAARLRERTDYGEVVTAYLLQNPAVECARYNLNGDRAVAVPLFVARSDATERAVPAKLELDRGGIVYADPLGSHPRMTDAIEAEVERQRALAADGDDTFEATLVRSQTPMATDGEG
jgi:sirohydrochlorin ferrochelatase